MLKFEKFMKDWGGIIFLGILLTSVAILLGSIFKMDEMTTAAAKANLELRQKRSYIVECYGPAGDVQRTYNAKTISLHNGVISAYSDIDARKLIVAVTGNCGARLVEGE